MSFESLQKSLSALQEITSQIQTDITRLSTLRFEPGTTKAEAEVEVTELNDEIAFALREQNEVWELFDQEIQDLPDGRAGGETQAVKQRMLEKSQRAKRELKEARAEFSKAQRNVLRNLKFIERASRELHIQNLVNPPKSDDGNTSQPISRKRTPGPEMTQDEKEVAAAGDVTSALRRTHALLATELSKSQFAHDTLKESSAALNQLGDNYMSLDSMLASTRSVLSTLMKSQKSDTWYLETAFYILVATVGWLIFRRFIYGPAWWFIYLPLSLFWKSFRGVLALVGIVSSTAVVTTGLPNQNAGTTIIPGTSAVQATTSGSDAPEATVGGRGRGNAIPPMDEGAHKRSDTDRRRERPLYEEVGEMVEETREQAQRGNEGQAQEQPADQQEEGQQQQESEQHREEQVQRNPLKRQWDEAVEGPKHDAAMKNKEEEERKRRDEL